MNNKEYLNYLIENYQMNNANSEGLKDYLRQVRASLNPSGKEETQTSTSKGFQKSIGSGKITGGMNMYPEHESKNTIFNQQGATNFFMLALLTFFFETMFILLSLYIY